MVIKERKREKQEDEEKIQKGVNNKDVHTVYLSCKSLYELRDNIYCNVPS